MSDTKIKVFLFSFIILGLFYALSLAKYQHSFAQEEPIDDFKDRRNPFIPLVTPDGRLLVLDKEKKSSDLLVEGIIYDKFGRSFALVNGSVVAVGDFVGGYQVLKIEENKVIFIKGGEAREGKINKEEEK